MMKLITIFTLLLLTITLPIRADSPNVILVMSDDQGWTQTGYYGHPIAGTPNLDDMANSGLRMDRFYAGAPFCVPKSRCATHPDETQNETQRQKVACMERQKVAQVWEYRLLEPGGAVCYHPCDAVGV